MSTRPALPTAAQLQRAGEALAQSRIVLQNAVRLLPAIDRTGLGLGDRATLETLRADAVRVLALWGEA